MAQQVELRPDERGDGAAPPPRGSRAGAALLEHPLTRRYEVDLPRRRLRGRPDLYTAYRQDLALLNTPGKRLGVAAVLVLALALPFNVGDALLTVLATALVACIGAIGLNIVTGYAGQVSLGHAFFIGLGAYTAAVVGGAPERSLWAWNISNMLVWLPAAGLVAAVAGAIVAPLAVRLRGLYLAIVTLGLVILGEHLFKELDFITGGPGVGRHVAPPSVFGFRFDQAHVLLGYRFTRAQLLYLLMLGMLVVFAVLGRNLARSDVGRAFSAIRDRDIAAEVIGVDLTKYKVLAFAISSFYAGVTGALLYTISGVVEPGSFSLLLSVQFIAMILIGGVATISGSILGALFLSTLGYFTRQASDVAAVAFVSRVSGLNVFQLEAIMFGALIIIFLIVEPRGLYGIWVRIRNYWKTWPFSY